MGKNKKKRIYRVKALNGDLISIYLWKTKPPVKCKKDIVEIEVKNKKPITYFMRPDEALHIASGLFLALIEFNNTITLEGEDKYEKNNNSGTTLGSITNDRL